MMITTMMKISLFVLLAGLISGSSAQDLTCSQSNCAACLNMSNCSQMTPSCNWRQAVGTCWQVRPAASSFVSMEAVVEDEENDLDEENSSVSGDTGPSRDSGYDIEDKENEESIGSGSITKKYLRTN